MTVMERFFGWGSPSTHPQENGSTSQRPTPGVREVYQQLREGIATASKTEASQRKSGCELEGGWQNIPVRSSGALDIADHVNVGSDDLTLLYHASVFLWKGPLVDAQHVLHLCPGQVSGPRQGSERPPLRLF